MTWSLSNVVSSFPRIFSKPWYILKTRTASLCEFRHRLSRLIGEQPKVQFIRKSLVELLISIRDIYRYLPQYIRRLVLRIFQLIGGVIQKAVNAGIWLLAPRLIIRLLYRHCLAVIVLWIMYQIWTGIFHDDFVGSIARSLGLTQRNAYYRSLQRKLRKAQSYTEWKSVARKLDRLDGLDVWKADPRSKYFDHERIKKDVRTLRALMDAHDLPPLMNYLRGCLRRNIWGIGHPRLYSVARHGTKLLIEEYVGEVIRALQHICQFSGDDVTTDERKLAFFNEIRHAFGRSALLLSGGATLGLYHAGVIKALVENNLLPRVISGASVGAVICSIIGVLTDEELVKVADFKSLKLNFFPPHKGSAKRKIRRLMTKGVLMDITILAKCLRANVGDYTFQEAYDRSHRILNIVVSPTSGVNSGAMLMNYLTAPNVVVWSAALASCAIPLVYEPVQIMAKNSEGKIVPYLTEGLMWSDGSVMKDLPTQRLSELFNVNHFIVSQVNPHVIPFLSRNRQSSLPSKVITFLGVEIIQMAINLTKLGISIPFIKFMHYVMDQKYVGDITLVPRVTLKDYKLLLVNPSTERLQKCSHTMERDVWKQMSIIKNHCEIEFTLDECVRRMRAAVILEEISETRGLDDALRRVQSWTSDSFGLAQSNGNENDSDSTEKVKEKKREHIRKQIREQNKLQAQAQDEEKGKEKPKKHKLKKTVSFDTSVYVTESHNTNRFMRVFSAPRLALSNPRLPSPQHNVNHGSSYQNKIRRLSQLTTVNAINIPFRKTFPRRLSAQDLRSYGH